MQELAVYLAIFQLDVASPVSPACTALPFWRERAMFYFSIFVIVFLILTLQKTVRKALFGKILSGKKIQKIRHICVIWLCLSYSLTMNFALRILHCVKSTAANQGETAVTMYILSSNPLVQCFVGIHESLYVPAILALIFHGILFPIVSVCIIKFVRGKHISPEVPSLVQSFDNRLMWKYFLLKDYQPKKFWYRQVELGIFFISSICNEILLETNVHLYFVAYSIILILQTWLYRRENPYKESGKWKLPVRIYLSVCTLMYVLTNYSSSTVSFWGYGPKIVSVLAPITFLMIMVLFLILFIAYGATLNFGAKQEQKEIVKKRQSIRPRNISWSKNPLHKSNKKKVKANKADYNLWTSISKSFRKRVRKKAKKEARIKAKKKVTKKAKKKVTKIESNLAKIESDYNDYNDDTTEFNITKKWYQHYHNDTGKIYYECTKTSSVWNLPQSVIQADENTTVDRHYDHENKQAYYTIKRAITTWDKPEDPGVDIIVVGSRPKKFKKEKKRFSISSRSSSSSNKGSSLEMTLKYAREQLKKAKQNSTTVLPPKGIKAAGSWWQVLDEDGNTCYLNTTTNEVQYSLPSGWVRTIAKQMFGGSVYETKKAVIDETSWQENPLAIAARSESVISGGRGSTLSTISTSKRRTQVRRVYI